MKKIIVFIGLILLCMAGYASAQTCYPGGGVCNSDCEYPSVYPTDDGEWSVDSADGGTCKYNNITDNVWITVWNSEACANDTIGYDVYPAWENETTDCYEINHVVDGTYYKAVCPNKQVVGHNVQTTDCGCSINVTDEYPCTNSTFVWSAFNLSDIFFSGGDPNGDPCIGGGSCFSGLCEDGVCCDSVCNGECMICSGPESWIGTNGTCDYINAGSDPDSECDAVYCDYSANPPYYYGWDGMSCYYAINVSAENNVCDGAGVCGTQATVCVSESNELAATCDCNDAKVGCYGLSPPLCYDEVCVAIPMLPYTFGNNHLNTIVPAETSYGMTIVGEFGSQPQEDGVAYMMSIYCIGEPSDFRVGVYSLSGAYPDMLLEENIANGTCGDTYSWVHVPLTTNISIVSGSKYAYGFIPYGNISLSVDGHGTTVWYNTSFDYFPDPLPIDWEVVPDANVSAYITYYTTTTVTTTTIPPAPCVGTQGFSPMGCSGIEPQATCENTYIKYMGSYYQCFYPGGCTVAPPHPCYLSTTTTTPNYATICGAKNDIINLSTTGISLFILAMVIGVILMMLSGGSVDIGAIIPFTIIGLIGIYVISLIGAC